MGRNHVSAAIVRGVSASYADCIRPPGAVEPIDVGRAREQHAVYCAALENAGVRLIVLDADDRYPDGCYVEDTAVVAGDVAVICRSAAASRRGEEVAVAAALDGQKTLVRLEAPAVADGGDVLRVGDRVYVGLTARTNEPAVAQLSVRLEDLAVRGVVVTDVLHLKSAASCAGGETVVVSPDHVDERVFAAHEILRVPPDESYAANCLAVNDVVLVSEGYPKTKSLLESTGREVVAVPTTEFRKGGGSLTCLSILL